MLRRVLSVIRSRLFQAHQISSWRRRKLSKWEADDCDAIRRVCTCLLKVVDTAIEKLPPKESGALFSVLRKCIVIFAVLLSGHPPYAVINRLIVDLQHYANSRCPGVDICTTALIELMAITILAMQLENEAVPAFAAVLTDLRGDNCSYEQMQSASAGLRKIATRVSLAIFHESLPKFREKYSFRHMVAFTRGYRQEETAADNDEIFLEDRSPVEYNTDDTEAEYQAIGKRIELSAFCEPAEQVPKNTECSICSTGLSSTAQIQDQRAVATKCGHTFHKKCLDTWVNYSGMKASNTCPSCRTVLCTSRERVHASVEAGSVAGIDGNDDASVSDDSSVESFSALPPHRWLEARVEALLHLHIDGVGHDAPSLNDDSSIASSRIRESTPLSEIIDVLRAERLLRTRVSSF